MTSTFLFLVFSKVIEPKHDAKILEPTSSPSPLICLSIGLILKIIQEYLVHNSKLEGLALNIIKFHIVHVIVDLILLRLDSIK